VCELLIKAKDHTHPDPTKDRRGAYKRGMVGAVCEDGHSWGRLESKQQWIAEGNDPALWHDKTVIVKIPGALVVKVEALLAPQEEDDTGAPLRDVDGTGVPEAILPNPEDYPRYTYRRRLWKLAIDNIPAGVLNALKNDGEVTVTPAQVRNYLKRIRDDAQFTGLD